MGNTFNLYEEITVIKDTNCMAKKMAAETLVHPDIAAFLKKEVMKNTSLSPHQIAKLIFCQNNEYKITALNYQTYYEPLAFNSRNPAFEPVISVPNLNAFFKQTENNRLIEIHDDELPDYLKTKKNLFRCFLKHEEGHYLHNPSILNVLGQNSPILSIMLSIIIGVKFNLSMQELFCIAPIFTLGSWILPQYYEEIQADAYAQKHIDDPKILREVGNYFLKLASEYTETNQAILQQIICAICDGHPSSKSKGLSFIKAAEKLERKYKD